MSRLDEWEHRRGPVKRRKPYQKPRVNPKEVQLAMKLFGSTTAKDRGEPFNDDISFLGAK